MSLTPVASPVARRPDLRSVDPSCPAASRRARVAIRALGATLGLDAHQPPSPRRPRTALPRRVPRRARRGARRALPVLPPNAPFDADDALWVDGLLAGLFSRTPEPDRGRRDAAPERGDGGAPGGRCCGRRRRATPRTSRPPRPSGWRAPGSRRASSHGRLPPGATCRRGADLARRDQHVRRRRRPRQRRRVLGVAGRRRRAPARRVAVRRARPRRLQLRRLLRPRRRLDDRLERARARRGWCERVDCEPDDDEPGARAGSTRWRRPCTAATPHGRRPARRRRPPDRARPRHAAAPRRRAAHREPAAVACPGSARRCARSCWTSPTARARSPTRRATRSACGPSNSPGPRRRVARRHRAGTRTSVVDVDGAARCPLRDALHHQLDISRDHARPARASSPNGPAAPSCATSCAPATASDLARWTWGRQAVDVVAELARRRARRGPGRGAAPPRSRGSTRSRRARCVDAGRGRADGVGRPVRVAVGRAPRAACARRSSPTRRSARSCPCFVQRTPHFRPPADPTCPLIMVGPGHRRRAVRRLPRTTARRARAHRAQLAVLRRAAPGHRLLLPRRAVAAAVATGTLDRLDHRVLPRPARPRSTCRTGCASTAPGCGRGSRRARHFYVCGDASRMAKDVDAALREIVATHGGLSADGRRRLRQAPRRRQRRYVRDVY